MSIEIRVLTAAEMEKLLPRFAEILCESVLSGASMHFLADITQESAKDFWRGVLEKAQSNSVRVLGAFVEGVLAGTVTLVLDTPPNQQHRADVSKLLVSSQYRRRGIARALMSELENVAQEAKRRLLVLDTGSGSGAEFLYLELGWIKVGEIPRYSLEMNGELLASSYFYKELTSPNESA
ncbi:MAG: GNAT family N-acetyltransferase [Actinobacteria bacterium]|nr:GNAT family N-acetyltransferase [Actinomycetota bacterium]